MKSGSSKNGSTKQTEGGAHGPLARRNAYATVEPVVDAAYCGYSGKTTTRSAPA